MARKAQPKLESLADIQAGDKLKFEFSNGITDAVQVTGVRGTGQDSICGEYISVFVDRYNSPSGHSVACHERQIAAVWITHWRGKQQPEFQERAQKGLRPAVGGQVSGLESVPHGQSNLFPQGREL